MVRVKAVLVCGGGCRHQLVLDTVHPRSIYGLGIMRVARADEILGGRIIDGASLHDDPNARIVTNNAEAVCRALGVPYPDAQVVEVEEEGALS